MENKRKNIYIVIFVITTIIAACAAVYFKVDGDKKINEVKAKLEEQNVNKNNTQDTESVESENTENNSNKVTDNNKESCSLKLPIFNNNCINNKDKNIQYNITTNYQGIYCKLNKDNKSVNIDFDWDKLKSLYGINIPSGLNNNHQSVKISNFDKEICNIYIYGFGQAIGQETVLFLMSDGTVEYMPLRKSLKNQEYKSYGKIAGIEEIVTINSGSCTPEFGGWYDIFAIKQDGSFYILSTILEKTGNYNF